MSNDQLKRNESEGMDFTETSGSQQLRNGYDETQAYSSEAHRHVYQNTSQSFDMQRDQYAEQAMNSESPPPEKYDYQATFYAPAEDTPNPSEFQRYTSGIQNRIPNKTDNDHDSAALSIFSESDFELANATENYLDKNNEKFSQKLDTVNKKINKTRKKISRIEYKGLQYDSYKRRIVSDHDKVRLLKKQHERQYYGKGNSQRIHVITKRQLPGRLKFRKERTAFSKKAHDSGIRRKENGFDRRIFQSRHLYTAAKNQASGSEFQDDEVSALMKEKGNKAARSLGRNAKRNYRRLKHELDGYNRLKFQNVRLASLNAQNARIAYKSGIDLQKRKAEEAARQGLLREKSKQKIKKEMVQSYKREQGNFFRRVKNQHNLKKTVKKERRIAKKRVKAIMSSLIGLVSIIIIVLILFLSFLFILINMASDSYANTVSQNDYYDMTAVTAYFREKEAELEEYIKPENLEPVILQEDPEIYEFIYSMDEIGFDANTLVAYLSAKYNEFDLAMVKGDLDEIFELYYTLEWEIKEEEREVPDESQPPDPVTGTYPLVKKLVRICYVSLKKTDFYELLKGRIDDAAKQNQMDGFYISGNGQQVYGPVMQVDWRKKISSNYGWRIHPITGIRTFHDGVDIAVPTGTAVYSAVKGTVIKSYYSDSGGNMITIQNDTGWQVTFMHMDSRTVKVGDSVIQGQLVGFSGNTGNSTGPHLHLQVHDAEDQPVNPVFLIPFSTIEASETF